MSAPEDPATDDFESSADAAGTWPEWKPPFTKKPDEVRWDLTRLLVVAVLLVVGGLLGLVAAHVVSVEGAVQLAAAVLSPLFTLLGLAVGYHFKDG